ncbi:hypothetical protein BTVI_64973 [Pitangus sulphuratus]|nr:hypothetical protein BTVI_64973 [Pitangus sulphuratus]
MSSFSLTLNVLLLSAAFNPLSTQPAFVLGIVPTQVQNLALGLVELHKVCIGPPLQLFKIPLDSISSSMSTTQLGVLSKLAENAFDLIVYIVHIDVKQCWSQYLLLRNTTHHWSPLGHPTTGHNSLAATTQPILYPPSGPSIKSMSVQFSDKGVMRDSIKCLAQVQVASVALALSTNSITQTQKPTKFVRCDLPLVKSCWLSQIFSLFPMCLRILSRRTCCKILLSTEVRLTGL